MSMIKNTQYLFFILFISTQAFSNTLPPGEVREYTLPEIIQKVRTKNYEIRSKAEEVYQARKNIRISMARLLPSLNFGTVMAGVTAATEGKYFDLAASLFGFLFPTNWFNWKESKLFFEAERRSYAAMMANQINTTESLTYRVHLSKNLIDIYDFYLKMMDEVLKVAQTRAEMGQDTRDLVLQIENLQILMHHDLILLRSSLVGQYAELAHGIGLPKEEWKSFRVATIGLPHLEEIDPLEEEEMIPVMLQKSLELREISYLSLAAKYSKKARIFEFLTPGGSADSSLGFGYLSYLQIAGSKIRQIGIKKEEMTSNLHGTMKKAVDQYNMNLDLYENTLKGLKNAQEWYRLLDEKFRLDGEYSAQDFVAAIESMFTFHSQVVGVQHQYLIAKAQISRLLLRPPYFQQLLKLAPNKITGTLTAGQKGENIKIKKDLESGTLILPDSGEDFE